jgi:uridine kinase
MSNEITDILKRTGGVVPFDREKIRVAVYKATASIGQHDEALAERVTTETVSALARAYAGAGPTHVEDVQDLIERVLVKSGNADVAKAFILYRHERAQLRMARRTAASGNIPYKAMWESLDWAVEHGCHTVDALNGTIRSGGLPELIAASDRRYEADIQRAAERILSHRDELRFIIVAGPSSSGKTTTTHKLAQHLERHGLAVVPLPLDNYFFDLELHPGDEFGDSDFETPEALDLNLINRHLAELDSGRPIDMPIYDFKTGRRRAGTSRFDPGPDSLILLDTLHGLYDGLTESVPDERKFRLYIETISQLKDPDGRYVRWADIRMLRRMARDARYRGYRPERTILHWHYVRRAELKHIIPHQGKADVHVNGALAYELPFLKLHLFEHLRPFLDKWHGDEKRLDGFMRASRVHRLLASIESVEDDAAVPETSLLREFIGGSGYDLH